MKLIDRLWVNNDHRKSKLFLLGLGLFLVLIGNIIGISDNPPGIITAYAGLCTVAFAFVYKTWQLKKLVILLIGSVLGLPVFGLLHNLFYGLGSITNNLQPVKLTADVLSVLSFLAAIFLCPVGFLVAITGMVLFLINKNKSSNIKSNK